MSERKVSEVLDLAADEIQRRGWFSYGYRAKGAASTDGDPWGGGAGSNAPVCLEGGIAAAMGVSLASFDGSPESNFARVRELRALDACPAYRAVEEYLFDTGRLMNRDLGHLYSFNDTTGRSKDEVIAVLRAAAAVERAKEESLEGAEVIA